MSFGFPCSWCPVLLQGMSRPKKGLRRKPQPTPKTNAKIRRRQPSSDGKRAAARPPTPTRERRPLRKAKGNPRPQPISKKTGKNICRIATAKPSKPRMGLKLDSSMHDSSEEMPTVLDFKSSGSSTDGVLSSQSSADDAHSQDGKELSVDSASGQFSIAVLERDTAEEYGVGKWRPRCLQFFARRPLALLIVLCILNISHAYIHFGVLPAASSQLQRRFHITPGDMASIRLMFEIGALMMLLPVLYFNDRGIHRAQWIGIGGLVVGIGGAIMIIPHCIIVVMQKLTSIDPLDYCHTNKPPDLRCQEPFSVYKYLFMELLVGAGMVPTYVLGVTYLDENITHRMSGIYTTILNSCHQIGPLLSFVLTSLMMRIDAGTWKIYEDKKEYHHDHDHEYGSWWISLCFGIFMCLIGAIIIMPYPRQLSGAAVARVRDAQEAMKLSDRRQKADMAFEGPRVWRRVKALLTNPVFIGSVLDEMCRVFSNSGFIFLGKYLEAVFNLSSARAGLYVGFAIFLIVLFGAGFGTLIQHLGQLDVTGNLRLCVVSALVAMIFSMVFSVGCNTDTMIAGVTTPYLNNTRLAEHHPSPMDLTNECNKKCECNEDRFHPVCFESNSASGFNNTTYYSSCFAGCPHRIQEGDGEPSNICECVPRNGIMKLGSCSKCSSNLLFAFLIGLSWFGIWIYLRENARQQLVLRSVHYRLRTAAIAIFYIGHHTAAIPGTFVFARIMDGACHHHGTHCGYRRCIIYNRNNLSTRLNYTLFCVCATSFLILLVTIAIHEIRRLAAKKMANLKKDQTTIRRRKSKGYHRRPLKRDAARKRL